MKKFLAVLAAFLLLAACTARNYDENGFATAVEQISDTRYKIEARTQRGDMPQAQVELYALLKAAEVSKAAGYEGFRVIEGKVATQRNYYYNAVYSRTVYLTIEVANPPGAGNEDEDWRDADEVPEGSSI